MVYIENAYDPERDQNQFPSGRDIQKSGSGLFWNFCATILAPGSEPVFYEPPDPHLKYMRRNVAHFAGGTIAPAPRRGMWDRAGGWLASVVAPRPKAAIEPSHVPVVAEPEPEVQTKPASPRERATTWLRETLGSEPLRAPELERRAVDDGHALKTVRRAAKALGIKPERRAGSWWWRLPDQQDGRAG
jgi:hypothetical protein